MAERDGPETPRRLRWLRVRLRSLYHGASDTAVKFRLGIIVLDLAVIAFFIAAPIMRRNGGRFYVIV